MDFSEASQAEIGDNLELIVTWNATMDRLDAMQLFVRVAELGSFSAVAQQMDIARSVVTRQVAALENHLGVKLMARSTRRLALTAGGAAYLEKCRVILTLVETAESDVAEERQTPRGAIRISLPLRYGLKRLAPLLLEFAQRYPEVSLEMDYSDRRANLIEEGIDLAIRITSRLEPGNVARRIATEHMVVVAAPDYLARHGTPRHPADLIHHECLGYTAATNHNWQFRIDGKLESFPVRSRISTNNGDVLVDAATLSLGITCQPEFIAAGHLADGRVRIILAEFPLPELGVYAILPGNRYIPHRVRVLMDWLAKQIAR
ncbi:LysR family transcriptional regulator [Rugosibacter aromaticivorans]|nr:LysR family transcriptional regulator [Rugosibacter aromaticivorans]